MPRETVHGNEDCDVVMIWGRDAEYVQIASIVPDSFTQIMDTLNATLRDLNMDEVDVVELQRRAREKFGPDDDDVTWRFNPFYEGWYTSISSRRGLNQLIAALKRARNQAMGADE